MTIRRLPDELARKIAAGEVVERPLSVVKELLENSLDAGASSIRVELIQGGKTLISLTDDGSGIAPKDLPLAVEKHATSKIATDDDLEAIRSLGYRGEALASVAAVARLELYSRQADRPEGASLLFENGRPVVRETSLAPGTTVTVRDLFYNLPARRKFMKSAAAEYRRIARLVQDYALCWPAVKFQVTNDGAAGFSSRADGTTDGALAQLWGRDPEIERRELERDGSRAELWRQDTGPGSRFQLIVFVNGRRVTDGALRAAILSHPWANRGNWFLKLTVPPEEVDVNVHPAKTEVLFRKGSELFDLVRRTAEGFARDFSSLPLERAAGAPSNAWRPPARETDFFSALQPPPFRVASSQADRPAPDLWDDKTSGSTSAWPTSVGHDRAPGETAPAEGTLFADQRSQVIYFGQTDRGYLVFQDVGGLLLVDPHAAHERINYERFLNEAGEGRTERLAVPLPLAPDLEQACTDHRSELAELGFGFDDENHLVQLPCHRRVEVSVLELLRGALAAIDDETGLSRPLLERFATRACKASIKLTARLAQNEACHLLADLMACSEPNACPHGRPTVLRLTTQALDDHFGRNGM